MHEIHVHADIIIECATTYLDADRFTEIKQIFRHQSILQENYFNHRFPLFLPSLCGRSPASKLHCLLTEGYNIMFHIHKTRTQTNVYRSIFTHHSLQTCNQFTPTEWKKQNQTKHISCSFIHSHFTQEQCILTWQQGYHHHHRDVKILPP